MKLKNKRTGDIWEFDGGFSMKASQETAERAGAISGSLTCYANSLAELNEEWEDYEEPKIKKYWWVSPLDCGVVEDDLKWNESEYDDEIDKFNVEIGNYFGSKEEAEQAVEKLRALKRLKDKGFRFEGWQDLEAYDETERLIANRIVDGENIIGFRMDDYRDCIKDLNTCFGGEE